MPTIAAINGHAYAAGAIFVLAFDYKVMRKDRGWFCIPESRLRLKLGEENLELIRRKIHKIQTLRDAAIFSKRYSADEALNAGIIDEAVEESSLLDAAIKYGRNIAGDGLNRDVVKAVKDKLFGDPMREKRKKDRAITREQKMARMKRFAEAANKLASKM